MSDKKEEYEPFGEEWKKELMKMTKPNLIEMFKKVCQDQAQLDRIITEIAKKHPEYLLKIDKDDGQG